MSKFLAVVAQTYLLIFTLFLTLPSRPFVVIVSSLVSMCPTIRTRMEISSFPSCSWSSSSSESLRDFECNIFFVALVPSVLCALFHGSSSCPWMPWNLSPWNRSAISRWLPWLFMIWEVIRWSSAPCDCWRLVYLKKMRSLVISPKWVSISSTDSFLYILKPSSSDVSQSLLS